MTYDQWKCTDPREYEPEPEECWCEDYDEDWEGRCTCGRCGRIWYKTAADIKADAEREAAFERYIRRTEWKDWLLFPWRRFRAWAFPRKASALDDDIPF